MQKLAIIHFSPIEYYPPVMNDILEVDSIVPKIECQVYTSPAANMWFTSKNVVIKRVGFDYLAGAVRRYTQYIWFNLRVFISLLFNPTKIMAYETLSILPVYLILLIRKNIHIHIHYHEYTSLAEIEKGSAYFKLLHRLEKKLWRKCNVMLSHTNEDRKRLFLEDYAYINKEKVSVFPNYPPSSWYAEVKKKRKIPQAGHPVRLVHVGALGLESMYVRELVDWVVAQNGQYSLDLYISNSSSETSLYLRQITEQYSFVRVRPSVRYYDLPNILANYDVGLVLYNGHIPNFVYNVPNKVFEYLSCGLQVWYSDKLISTRKFIQENALNDCFELNYLEMKNKSLSTIDKKYNDFFFKNKIIKTKITEIYK